MSSLVMEDIPVVRGCLALVAEVVRALTSLPLAQYRLHQVAGLVRSKSIPFDIGYQPVTTINHGRVQGVTHQSIFGEICRARCR